MKKIGFITVLVLSSTIIFSQAPRFGYDIGFSLNRSKYEPDNDVDRRIFGGFDGGTLVEFHIRPKFMIQPEVNFTMSGVELNNGANERTLKLAYISIPILAKFNVAKGLNLVAGPQHSILLSAWSDPSGAVSTRMKEYFKFDDFVVVMGGEYKFGNGMFFTARYNLGMEQLAEENVGFEMKNRSVTFRIGYVFGK